VGKWEMVRLGDVCVIVNGFAFDSTLFNENKVGTPIIRIRNVLSGFSNTYSSEIYDAKYIIHSGDILIGMDGEFNIGIWKSDDALLNQRVCKLEDNPIRLNKKYVYYYLPKALKVIEEKTAFVTVKHLSSKTLNELKIPLPPLEIQRQIADVLDRASALIEKRKAQIEKLDLLVKSQFIEMFGDPVTNPKGWEKQKLGECLHSIENGVSPNCEVFSASPEKQGVLKLSAITYGNYQADENKQLLPDTVFNSRIEVVNKDLLMTRKNTYELVGMSAYVFSTRPGLMLPDLIFRLIPKDSVHRIYLWQLINCDLFRESIKRLAGGTAGSMPNISKERLKSLAIPVPSHTLQKDFAAFVERVETQKALLQESLAKLEVNYKSITQKCFNGEMF